MKRFLDLFRRHFPKSRRTDECAHCGNMAAGTNPVRIVVCVECMERFRFGACDSSGCVCLECAIGSVDFTDPATVPVVPSEWPDGYTCAECGECFGCEGGED